MGVVRRFGIIPKRLARVQAGENEDAVEGRLNVSATGARIAR